MNKTQTLRSLSVDRNYLHGKSLNNFVLLNQNRQISQKHQWKPLMTNEMMLQRTNSLNKNISFGGSYSHRKSILNTIHHDKQTQQKMRSASKQLQNKKQIQTDILLKSKLGTGSKKKQQTQSTDIKISQKTQNLLQNKQKMQSKLNNFANTTIHFNQMVEQNIINFKINSFKAKQFSNTSKSALNQFHTKALNAHEKNERLIVVITMKRYGLRMRLKHAFSEICMCNRSSHLFAHKLQKNTKINALVKQMLSTSQNESKPLYYFRLNKEQLTSSSQMTHYQNVILASQSPILNLDNEFYLNLYEQAEKLQKFVRSTEEQLGINFQNLSEQRQPISIYISPSKKKVNFLKQQFEEKNNQSTQYDWQIITNIDQYVDKIVQNPQNAKNNAIPNVQKDMSLKNQIRALYNQKFDTDSIVQTGEGFRNPLLQDHGHFHSELKQRKILSAISSKLQQQTFIKNNHILKRQSIETLIQKAKQQKQKQQQQLINPNILKRNIQNMHQTKKSLIRQLDSKNTLLFEQNIPYMMDKYGISRYQIHNIFTIYKTLEKISAMKLHTQNKTKKVLEKGIDRSTFDEGMKRLDINPGEQVIKNICYFNDFISWQQFIKIVSIGLRKTPEQKIEAILSGIGGSNKGVLSKNQISIMIGSSLNKIFDSEQTELKQYFTEVAMKDLDSDGNGHVQVDEIKNKCLDVTKSKDQNLDLVTFLLLNS